MGSSCLIGTVSVWEDKKFRRSIDFALLTPSLLCSHHPHPMFCALYHNKETKQNSQVRSLEPVPGETLPKAGAESRPPVQEAFSRSIRPRVAANRITHLGFVYKLRCSECPFIRGSQPSGKNQGPPPIGICDWCVSFQAA